MFMSYLLGLAISAEASPLVIVFIVMTLGNFQRQGGREDAGYYD